MVAVVVGLVGVLALYYGFLSGGGTDPGATGEILADDPTLAQQPENQAPSTGLPRGPLDGERNQPGILSESVAGLTGGTSAPASQPDVLAMGAHDVLGSERTGEPIPVVHDPNDSLIRELPTGGKRPVVTPDPGKGDITIPAGTNPPINDPTLASSQKPTTPEVKANTPVTTPLNAPPAITPATVAPSKPEVYTIKEGDTMSSIAQAWFGDGKKWDLIAKANPLVDPTKMQVGQKLNLPAKSTEREKPKPGTREYVVRPGDTLVDIARAVYGDGARWKAIYDANKSAIGADPDHVTVGMKLTIPALATRS